MVGQDGWMVDDFVDELIGWMFGYVDSWVYGQMGVWIDGCMFESSNIWLYDRGGGFEFKIFFFCVFFRMFSLLGLFCYYFVDLVWGCEMCVLF